MRRLPRLLIAALLVVGGLWLAGPAAAQPPPGTQPAPPTTTTLTPPAAPVPPDVAAAAPAPTPPVGPGLFDLAGRIREAINGWFRDLVASALNPTLDLVGRSVLATPDLTAPGGRVRELWGTSAALANTAYVLLVVVGGLLLMAHESLQTRYTVKDVAPRLVVGILASNLSLLVVGHAIELTNAVSAALLGQGVPPEHVSATLKAILAPPLDDPDLLLVLVALVVVVLALVLVGCYVVRVALLVLLVVAAPLALACHALPQTEELAQWWWRATAACLGVQVGQSLALITALRVFFQADRATVLGLGGGRLVDLLVAVCLLWLLVRIPTWAGRMVFAGRPSTLVGVAKSYVVYRLLRRSLRTVAG
jgi:hypothetical protein